MNSAQDDWQLAGMICKTLWNFAGGLTDTSVKAVNVFGEAECEDLRAILVEFLGLLAWQGMLVATLQPALSK